MFTLVATTPVPRPPRFAPGRAPWLVLVLVIAVAGAVAATGLTVQQKADTASLFAERHDIGERFTLAASSFFPASATVSAVGVDGSPVELSSAAPVARTALTQDQWVYALTLSERAVGEIESGTFTVALTVDGVAKGTVFVTQGTAEASAVESVQARFAIGSTLATDALYFVVVKPFVPVGDTVAFTLQSTPSGDLTWTGNGGTIAGQVNPSLAVKAGDTVQLTALNGDGITHDIGIKTAGGALVDPPGYSADVDTVGESTIISWKATAGTFTYVCKYHPSTMKGTLTVSA